MKTLIKTIGLLAALAMGLTHPLSPVQAAEHLCARVFPNEKSLLRLITVLLCETSDDWETGKIYLSMECQTPPTT